MEAMSSLGAFLAPSPTLPVEEKAVRSQLLFPSAPGSPRRHALYFFMFYWRERERERRRDGYIALTPRILLFSLLNWQFLSVGAVYHGSCGKIRLWKEPNSHDVSSTV